VEQPLVANLKQEKGEATMSEIKSFDDLAQDTKFSFKGNTYVIPAISNEKAEKLFKMGKKTNKDKPEFASDELKQEEEFNFVDEQNKFICAIVVDEQGNAVTEEMVSQWPMKVSLAVVKLINECISGIKEDTPEEKKQ